MRRTFFLLLLFIVACSKATPPSPSATAEPAFTYTGLNLESLATYQTTFRLQFEGVFDWVYDLETRTDGDAVEYRLRLEGLSLSDDPGDVRLVLENGISRMRGPGTDDECLQFPSDLDLGLVFLTPDHLVNPDESNQFRAASGAEAGVGSTHYILRQAGLDDWRDLELDLWLDNATAAVLRYDLRATGSDPLFDAGVGVLSGRFLLAESGPQMIEPIAGCESDLPLPSEAARVIRLPGMIAFDSAVTPAEITIYYQAALAEAGWESLAEPEAGADATLLRYQRGVQTLEINVEKSDEGVHVELLLGDE